MQEIFKNLLEKGIQLVLNRNNIIITFNSSFILLFVKIDLILEK